LAKVHTYLDVGGAELLVQYGISMMDVRVSFAHLMLAQNCLHLEIETQPTNTGHFRDLVGRLLQSNAKSSYTADIAHPGCIVISADPCDPEAAAAACILTCKTQEVAPTLLKEGICFLSDCMGMGIVGHCLAVATARALVVILSSETLTSRHQLEIISHATGLNEKGQGPLTISANVLGFSFPGASYHDQVLPQIWPQVSKAQAHHVCSFFRAISCPYSVHASDQVLRAQTKAIVGRIPLGKHGDCAALPPTMLQSKPSASVHNGSPHKSTHQEWV